jgi:CMP-N-acetylneuraminic acid synthetase
MNISCVALVPMRHESVRVPQKNYRLFDGKPLFHHILNTLRACPSVTNVVIDTNSPVIEQGAKQHFPEVQIIERPESLCADTIPMNEILLHDIEQVKAEVYLQTHSTNPLLTAESIEKAIALYKDSIPKYDSLFSVTRLQSRLWDKHARPINHNPKALLRTQDLEPLFEENSCFYLFSEKSLIENKNRIGRNPLQYELDRIEAIDIDEETDFQLAELLFKASLQNTTL